MPLQLPAGWKVAPATPLVTFPHEDQSRSAQFPVHRLPVPSSPGAYSVKSRRHVGTATGHATRSTRAIQADPSTPHIERRQTGPSGRVAGSDRDVKTAPNLTVGYVMGVGDQVPPAIEQLGAKVGVHPSNPIAFAWGNLSAMRPHRHRRARLRAPRGSARLQPPAARPTQRTASTDRQCNKMEFNEAQCGPFPAVQARTASPTRTRRSKVLVPTNPIFTFPELDWRREWKNWVQERWPVSSGREGSADYVRPGVVAGFVSCEQSRRKARVARGGESRQGPLALPGSRALASAAGRH